MASKAIGALWCLTGAAILVSGCSGPQMPAGSEVSVSGEPGSSPDIVMPTLDGDLWDIKDHRGKVVLVNIWATWCPPCRAETPDLVRLANDLRGKDVEFAGISVDRDGPDVVRRFVRDYSIPYPILMPTDEYPLPIEARSIPVTIIVDREGKVREQFVGSRSEREFRQAIESVL